MIRHTTIDADPRSAALQNSENARDAIAELELRPVQRQITVERYLATASTSTRIRIGAGARPWAVTLARAAKVYGEDEVVAAVMIPNFVWESTSGSIDVYEPSGLTANTEYVLQFLITEAA